jgi:hypothetical protein
LCLIMALSDWLLGSVKPKQYERQANFKINLEKSMKYINVLAVMTACALSGSNLALAETYVPTPNNITSTSQNVDLDGVFTVSVPQSLWINNTGTIVGRNGTIYGRNIQFDGKVTEFSHGVNSGATLSFTKMSGVTEFYAMRHCYTYSNSTYKCYDGTANLTIVSKPNKTNFTNVKPIVPSVDLNHGNVCLPGQSC